MFIILVNTDFISNNCLFGSVNPAKDADPDKWKYGRYGKGFDFIT